MGKCLRCVERRLGLRALVFATVSTIVLAGLALAVAALRGTPPVEAAPREWPLWTLLFVSMLLTWRWIRRYPHEPRPRTRFVLKGIGWVVMLAAALVLLLEVQQWAAMAS